MFERQMMLSGLQKQHNILSNLLEEIENKPRFSLPELKSCQENVQRVACNLRKLRKIKTAYFASGEFTQTLLDHQE